MKEKLDKYIKDNMENEIKEILEDIKDMNNYSNFIDSQYGGKNYYYLLEKEESKQLLDYITNLQEKVNQYENPDDMTLMFMWCDEKAKDKMKQLQEKNKRLYKELEKADSITQSCIFEGSRSAGKSYRQCLNWLEDYKSRNEKAIEYIKDASRETLNNGRVFYNELPAQDLLNILQGEDKDE